MNVAFKIRPGSRDTGILPAAAYTSPAYAAEEKHQLWLKAWQVACREEDIPNPGDSYRYDILDHSAILVRTAASITAHRHPPGNRDLNPAPEPLKTALWAGYVFINFDPDCARFEQSLGPPPWCDPGEIGKMRYRWRQWRHFPCNWKLALEAVTQSYSSSGTYPQLARSGWHDRNEIAGPRRVVYDHMARLYNNAAANQPDPVLRSARHLVDVLPNPPPFEEISQTLLSLARVADAARGVAWPETDAACNGSAMQWHVLPNSILLHGTDFILGYRVRPDGCDPDRCIFEAYMLEHFPNGHAPQAGYIHQPELTEQKWRLVLGQHFAGLGDLQHNMKAAMIVEPEYNRAPAKRFSFKNQQKTPV